MPEDGGGQRQVEFPVCEWQRAGIALIQLDSVSQTVPLGQLLRDRQEGCAVLQADRPPVWPDATCEIAQDDAAATADFENRHPRRDGEQIAEPMIEHFELHRT